MSKKILISSFLASAIFLFTVVPAYASSSLSGWAWSSGIGWISFNSNDQNTGTNGVGTSTNAYGVTLATTTGNPVGTLSGYAWSPNIGWIKFGGLAGQQVNSTTTATDAAVNMTTGVVTGWARVCAGMDDQVTPPPDQTTPNNTCTGVSREDGWDGWIELSGANHATGDATGNGGVTFVPSTSSFVGYAWGGPVVGWLQFNTSVPVSVVPPVTPIPSSITGNCTMNPTSLTIPTGGGSVSSTATLTGVTGGNGTYTYNWWSGVTGSSAYTGSSPQTFTYSSTGLYSPTVTITDSNGATSGTITCQPPVSVTMNQPTLNIPELWPGSSQNPPADVTFSTSPSPGPTLSESIEVGSNASVSYTWPTANGMTCQGNVLSPNNWNPSNWNGVNLNLNNPNGTSGSVTFSGLATGIYQINMSCLIPSTQQSVFSNTVEIDVTPLTIREQ